MRNWLKDLYESLSSAGRDAAEDKFESGWSAFWSIITEHIKDIVAIILTLALLIFIVVNVVQCSDRQRAEKCTHEHVDMTTFRFDSLAKDIWVYCNDCKHERMIQKEVQTVPLSTSTCQTHGQEKVICSAKKYEGISFEYINELPLAECKTVVVEEEIAPTCLSEGRTAVTQCEWCGELYGGEVIPIGDHTWEDCGYVAPTCVTTGQTPIQRCKVCEREQGEHETIPTVAHVIISEYTLTETYEEGARRMGVCKTCGGDIVLEYTTQPLLTEYFDYTIDEEEGVAVLTALKKQTATLTVPGSVNGYPVKQITADVFAGNTVLEELILGEGIEHIGQGAFKDCISLREVTFPSTLTLIDEEAFYNCEQIRRLSIENGRIGPYAFAGCKNLRIVEIGNDTDGIGDNAFYDCFRIVFFKYPDYISSARTRIFDTEERFGNSDDYYVLLTSGKYSLLDNYYNGECADDVIICEDGFYYYKDSVGYYTLCSIDNGQKHIVLPDTLSVTITYISGFAFRDRQGEIESIVVPSTVSAVYGETRCYANITFYFEGTDSLSFREVGGSYYDAATGTTTEYSSVRYTYSAENKDGGPYWYYDAEGNICLHEYPYMNWGELTYYAMGDDITYGVDGNTENAYPILVYDALGLSLVVNYAKEDAVLSYQSGHSNLYNQAFEAPYGGARIMSFMFGYNDYILNIPMGTPEDTKSTTFYGALADRIKLIQNRFTGSFAFFITPIKPFVTEENDLGLTLEDYCNAIKEVCAANDIPVLDLYTLCEFTSATDPDSDGTTPTQEFVSEQIVPLIVEFIKNNYDK